MCRNDAQGLPENDKIVLVGHSFGGIIIKSLFAMAHNRIATSGRGFQNCARFLKSTRGLIFYAVPHSSGTIARYVENFNSAFQNRLAGTFRELSAFQRTMDRVSIGFSFASEYAQLRRPGQAPRDLKIYSFGEQLEYNKVSLLSYF